MDQTVKKKTTKKKTTKKKTTKKKTAKKSSNQGTTNQGTTTTNPPLSGVDALKKAARDIDQEAGIYANPEQAAQQHVIAQHNAEDDLKTAQLYCQVFFKTLESLSPAFAIDETQIEEAAKRIAPLMSRPWFIKTFGSTNAVGQWDAEINAAIFFSTLGFQFYSQYQAIKKPRVVKADDNHEKEEIKETDKGAGWDNPDLK